MMTIPSADRARVDAFVARIVSSARAERAASLVTLMCAAGALTAYTLTALTTREHELAAQYL